MVIWTTGLSGAGKSTLCEALWHLLKPRLPELVTLDGDAIRAAFGGDLGYAQEDRVVQIRRLQQLAKTLAEQELVVLVAALYSSPELLRWNREQLPGYFEVYVRASMPALRARDSKGLYNGTTENVVGVDIPWHEPLQPDLVLDTDDPEAPDVLARRVALAVPQLAEALA